LLRSQDAERPLTLQDLTENWHHWVISVQPSQRLLWSPSAIKAKREGNQAKAPKYFERWYVVPSDQPSDSVQSQGCNRKIAELQLSIGLSLLRLSKCLEALISPPLIVGKLLEAAWRIRFFLGFGTHRSRNLLGMIYLRNSLATAVRSVTEMCM
jgi:hypothetical protein